jgi:adenine-specific DNA methylase
MATKKENLAKEMGKAVGAGKPVALETVDFNEPYRPKTCLEVDFPILRLNEIATIEGKGSGALKPIYQTAKWWARRRSNVFRGILVAAATKAPLDTSHAAKLVWDNYYANHQKKGAFSHLAVADIFMGGGTTLIEGSRLGMQMSGNDLNPVAWFVVKQELAIVDLDEVKRLVADIEAEVRPQIMPFYFCDGPNGEKGKWTHKPSRRVMGADFDPLSIPVDERKDYHYEGPEIIYAFWTKHGPCQVTGCGHRTPIMTNPVMASKTVSVKHWEHACPECASEFHIEELAARLAPDVPLYVAPDEHAFTVVDSKRGVVCPHCGHVAMVKLGKGRNKKVELSLLVHPQWLAGEDPTSPSGETFGGSPQDSFSMSAEWSRARGTKVRLLEVRGHLPAEVICPETFATILTGKRGGTARKTSNYRCSQCGTEQDLLDGLRKLQAGAPVAAYAVQAFSKALESASALGGKFFAPFNEGLVRQINAASKEWESRRELDLRDYWPRSTTQRGQESTRLINHYFTEWSHLFNPRQLLVHSLLLKAIATVGTYSSSTREYILAAFQQYLRNQNMFCFWNMQRALEPMFSNNDFHPKANVVENGVFAGLSRGDFSSCCDKAVDALLWARDPWEIAIINGGGHSEKLKTGDPILPQNVEVNCCSATELSSIESGSIDLVVTDPPFGDLLQYSELSDFFYVWLRLVLAKRYPDYFGATFTPKALEVVSNKAREPEEPDQFYQRLLTQCWRESHRVMKVSGILAFTFHHSEDDPWVAVLESLFDAGFYLEATYPIRSDETKGEGEFGSKKIEYDIIHVCRKRTEEPKPVSWARMRRELLQDVRQLQQLLENHVKEGLPEADIQVIKRGKALEYFSRHYGKVYVDEGRPISVKDALVGINQLLDETSGKGKEPPPVTAEPVTRQFLRIFDGTTSQPRDQMQKFLRGSGMAPEEFEQRGWSKEEQKVFHVVLPLDLAQSWVGRHRRNMTSDYDQAMFLIGACYDGSGINAAETLKNENFRPHPALKALLEWHSRRGAKKDVRNAASRALSIYQNWESTHQDQVKQLSFFEDA